MIETILVLCAIVAVGLVGLLATILTPELMTEWGLLGLFTGLATGMPAGLWYHVLLYRSLARETMPVPARWWVSPTDLHPRLAPEQLARIRPWFVLGGIGFLVSVAGGMLAMAGLLLTGRS
ncbi:MAG: hypothetical protein ACREIS_12455 [Nitrospiraceae bacterium]